MARSLDFKRLFIMHAWSIFIRVSCDGRSPVDNSTGGNFCSGAEKALLHLLCISAYGTTSKHKAVDQQTFILLIFLRK